MDEGTSRGGRISLPEGERARLGLRLKEIRKAKGIKRIAVARAWECDQSNVANVELGRQNLSVPQAIAFARLVGMDVTELLQGFTTPDQDAKEAPPNEAA